MGRRALDLAGQRFGYLTALYPSGRIGRGRNLFWLLRCDCGNETEVETKNLRCAKPVTSCGCQRGRSHPMGVTRRELKRASELKRRALVRGQGGDVAAEEIIERMELTGALCVYCGEREEITVDHVIPLSRGGEHAVSNLLPACRSCNSSKGKKLLGEWMPPGWGDVCLLR